MLKRINPLIGEKNGFFEYIENEWDVPIKVGILCLAPIKIIIRVICEIRVLNLFFSIIN